MRQHDSGVLLCLCSKNNEADVAEVFARPDMVLRDEHIVASRINWKPKSRNLRSLAQELNLGLDSFLFLDDSAVECAEVEAGCPEVMVAQLPADEASIEPFLQHHWAFDRTAVTEEDRRRTQMYRQEAERARSLQKAPSLQEFLEKLELVVTIAELEDSDLERAAQLTNRTNQFNLTTVRRTPGEITSFLAGGGEARIVRVRDRFGDYGVVGLLLFEAQKAVRVDTFLLSCRVLGRGVEYEVTRALGRLAAARGRSHLEFPFRRTKKNSPALEFLEALPAERDAGVNDAVFRLEATAAQVVRASLLSEPLGADEVPRAKGDSAPVANGVILARIASQGGDIGRIRAQIAADLSHAPGVRSAAFVAPRSATEEKLAEIWRSVLHVSEVGVDDDFFELGGDSMQAVQIVSSAIAVGLSLEIDVALEHSTIARQAAWLESRPAARALTPIDTSSLSVPIPHRTQRMEDVYPLSFMQRFMLDQYRHANEERQPASGAYHYQQTIRFIDRRPPISLDAFREALIETARRRPMMRVAIVENEAGERVQAIERERWPVIGVTDLSHFREDEQTAAIDRAMRADRATPFDTRPGHAPLIRVSLFRRTNEQFECFFSCHHAIGDGWGAQQAFNEILQRYDELRRRAAPPVSAGPDSYKEFVALERERVRSPEARAFWSRHLAAREEAAPSWQPRESQPPGEPVDRRLAKDLFARVSSLTQRLHVSAKAVLLAPYLQLLGEWFGGKTVTVGVVAGNRSERLSDPLGAFGLFWSFMPFCTRLDEAAARPVHRSLLEAERFSDYPLAQIQSDLGVPELFWATFNFVHFHNATWANSTTDLEPRGMTLFDKFHFPLNWKVAIDPGSGAIDVTCTHDERLISSEKSRALLERYETLLVQSLTSQGAER